MRTEKGLESIVVPFYRLHILALTRVYHPRKFSNSLSDSPLYIRRVISPF